MPASALKSKDADPSLEFMRQTLDLQSDNSVEHVTVKFAKRTGFFRTTLEKIRLAVREIAANAADGTTVTLSKYIRQSQDNRIRKLRLETSI